MKGNSLIPVTLYLLAALSVNPEKKAVKPVSDYSPGNHVFADGGLHLRENPDTDAAILALIADGERLENLQPLADGGKKKWLSLQWQGSLGFVHRDFVKTVVRVEWNHRHDRLVLEVIPFGGTRGDPKVPSEIFVVSRGKRKKIESFLRPREWFWIDNRSFILRTRMEDANIFENTFRIDSGKGSVHRLYSHLLFKSGRMQCLQFAECLCEGIVHDYGNRNIFVEYGKDVTLYQVPPQGFAASGNCRDALVRASLKKLLTIPGGKLVRLDKYDGTLGYTDGRDQYWPEKDGKVRVIRGK